MSEIDAESMEMVDWTPMMVIAQLAQHIKATHKMQNDWEN
jgi:hypothetical protein